MRSRNTSSFLVQRSRILLIVAFIISSSVIAVADDHETSKVQSKEIVGKVPYADSVKFHDLDHGWMVQGYLKGKLVYMVRKLEKGTKAYKATNGGMIPFDVQDTIIIHTIKQN
jgi:hypothetical protein